MRAFPYNNAGPAVAVAVAIGVLLLAAPAPAATPTPGPGWSISSVAEPTNFSAAESKDAVQVFAVLATGGTYRLSVNGGETAAELSGPIAWNAGAQELQQALEAVPNIGAGNLIVTGGPGDETGTLPYRLEAVGTLSGLGLHLLPRQVELTGGAAEVRQEEAQDVAPEAFDRYTLTATNVGSRASEGVLTITDQLPPGLVVTAATVEERRLRRSGECFLTVPVKCEYDADPTHPLRPGTKLVATVYVAVTSPSLTGSLLNEASVSGGGAPEVSTTESTPVNAGPASFGIDQYAFEPVGLDGEPDLQAGDHSYAVTTDLSFNTVFTNGTAVLGRNYDVPQDAKDVSAELPLGFVGDPLAAERCPEVDMTVQTGAGESGLTACPPGSIVGEVWLRNGGEGVFSLKPLPVYNIAPQHGYPAELGFNYSGFGQPVFLYASLVPKRSGYSLRVSAPGTLRAKGVQVEGVALTIFGDPSAHNGGTGHAAFLSNPTACSAEPLEASVEATAWQGGSDTREATAYSQVSGCDQLQGIAAFGPQIEVKPETTQADTPSGYRVDLKVPQAPNVFGQLATPELRDATVTLPKGVAVNPSSANGLAACQATGPEGINIEGPEATELGEGHPGGNASTYDDGLIHATPGHCPAASTLGTVEVTTPLLAEPLQGHIYLGAPDCAPCTNVDAEEGKLVKLYIEVAGSGVIVKLPGLATLDPTTGQLSGIFRDNPQLPFEQLKVNFKSGPRAALVNPQTCGAHTSTSDLKPWSAPESGPDAIPSSSFVVISGPNGSQCVKTEAEAVNRPGFEAGTVTPIAGSYSPFVLKVSREDGSQRITVIDTTLPPGLVGKLAGVGECSDAQLAAAAAPSHSGAAEQVSPSCPLSSEVGAVNVGAGAGPDPYYVTGHAYLSGPYKGAPLSLAIITPAVAGPFDLGTVVVRTALYVNPETAQIHAVSDPIPAILQGIPLDVRSIALKMNRPNFTLNPTNCEELGFTGSALSVLNVSAPLTQRFQVGGCAALPFKPRLSLKLKGSVKRTANPKLIASLTMKPGEANIAAAQVKLPASAFLDNSHIGTVCTRVQFSAAPHLGEGCPPDSVYGRAEAISPLLDKPLEGNVYLRSSSNKLPDLVAALNGQIEVALAGRTDSVKGALRNSFEAVPDAPVSSFRLELFGGKRGLIQMSSGFCAHPDAAVKFVGQNAKVLAATPRVAAKCPKSHKKHRQGRHRSSRSV